MDLNRKCNRKSVLINIAIALLFLLPQQCPYMDKHSKKYVKLCCLNENVKYSNFIKQC